MINVHLYPSPFENESRILREARTLSRLKLFSQIDLVGVGTKDLKEKESVDEKISIRRFIRKRINAGLIAKIIATIKWSLVVFLTYRSLPLACINCHSIATLPLGCVLKYVSGAQLIYDAHELESETNGLHGLRKICTKFMERRLIRFVDYSIFVSDSINDWYKREYRIENTSIIYNCPNFVDVEPSNFFRERFNIPDRLSIFLYQGVIGEGRGIMTIVEAFAGLNEYAALMLMGYGGLVGRVKEQVKAKTNIYYHPAVPPDKLLDYTSAADFGLSVIEPSSLNHEYSMPNKLFEYLMVKKPVLVSQAHEQKSLVMRYGVGEVASEISVSAIRDAALRLLKRDKEELARAIEYTRKIFSWERQEMEIKRIYCDILGFRNRINGQA
jgi:glycosyltransferase involved in cell wall biosynthesis